MHACTLAARHVAATLYRTIDGALHETEVMVARDFIVSECGLTLLLRLLIQNAHISIKLVRMMFLKGRPHERLLDKLTLNVVRNSASGN